MNLQQFISSQPSVSNLESIIKSNGWNCEISRKYTKTPEWKEFRKEFKSVVNEITDKFHELNPSLDKKELKKEVDSMINDQLDELWGS